MRAEMWRWICLAATTVLAGCYAAPAPLVVLPGQQKTYPQFQADDAACRPADGAAAPSTLTPSTGATAPVPPTQSASDPDLSSPSNLAYLQCMAARGNSVASVPRAYPYPAYTY